jgi:hypothetical protein
VNAKRIRVYRHKVEIELSKIYDDKWTSYSVF